MTSTQPSVLIIEDEVQIRRFLRAGFELEGFAVKDALDASSGLKAAKLYPVDLVLVDLGLPDFDGTKVVEQIRTWSTVPIIVLSVRSDEAEKVKLLELGADNYIVKPFGMAELLAHARAALRRFAHGGASGAVVKAGHITIDLIARQVFADGRPLALTLKEYRLLQALAQTPDRVVTHQHLLTECWGLRRIEDTHYLRILVRRVRRKIERDPKRPQILLSETAVGYRLAQPDEKPQ